MLKLGLQHHGLKLYKVCINDDPGLTLTYFMARSNLVAYTFEKGKVLQSHLMGKTCSKGLNWLTYCVYEKKFTPGGCLPLPGGCKGLNWLNNCVNEKKLTPGGCLPLPQGYIHIYDLTTIFKDLPLLNRLANQSQISCGASLGRSKESLYKWSRSHDHI